MWKRVLWVICGYAMCFGSNIFGGWIGWNKDYFFLQGIDTTIMSAGIPEYVFATWREIKNKYHIEVFRDLDSVDGIKACDTEMLIVLFMLEDNSVKVITREDFYGK